MSMDSDSDDDSWAAQEAKRRAKEESRRQACEERRKRREQERTEALNSPKDVDLFDDGGAIKSVLVQGAGWATPREGDEVIVSLRVVAADGTVVDDRSEVELLMGSDDLGPISTAVDAALKSMNTGEKACIRCTRDYAYGDTTPDGASVELTLLKVYEITDVSYEKDKSLMKKTLREGEGWERPTEASKVKLRVVTVVDGAGGPLVSFDEPKDLSFIMGNVEICEALENAAFEMRKSETVLLTCTRPADHCIEKELALCEPFPDKVVFAFTLCEFENSGVSRMTDEEKLTHMVARKDVGSALFKANKTRHAQQRYKHVIELVDNVSEAMKHDEKLQAHALRRVCELNSAACLLKMGDLNGAKDACDRVLQEERCNVKALFRRASAQFQLGENGDALRDLKLVLQHDPANSEARRLLPQVQRKQKSEDDKHGLRGMFKATDNSPILDSHDNKAASDVVPQTSAPPPLPSPTSPTTPTPPTVAPTTAVEIRIGTRWKALPGRSFKDKFREGDIGRISQIDTDGKIHFVLERTGKSIRTHRAAFLEDFKLHEEGLEGKSTDVQFVTEAPKLQPSAEAQPLQAEDDERPEQAAVARTGAFCPCLRRASNSKKER